MARNSRRFLYGMVWYASISTAHCHKVPNALSTLLPREHPSLQALFEGAKVLLCAEVVGQSSVPWAVHSECSAAITVESRRRGTTISR